MKLKFTARNTHLHQLVQFDSDEAHQSAPHARSVAAFCFLKRPLGLSAMEIVSFVFGAISFLSDCCATTRGNLISIGRLQMSLKTDKEKLMELRDDRVEKLDAELETVLHQVEERERETQQRCCRSYFYPTSLRSRYKLGKMVFKKLKDVSDLTKTGESFGEVADMLPPPLVDQMPLDNTVGMNSNFTEVWSYFCDPGVGIIGIYGMGGVGKTSLLTQINNELLGRVGQDYDVVIWAVVSRDLNTEMVQDTIGRKLGFPDDVWNRMGQLEKRNSIFRVLKTKRFVLLLDDVWDAYDLTEAGVPLPSEQNKAKVVLTTR
ncbi:hypothetical protein V6N13_015955 [Hibiscus sabdariffa]